MPRGALGRARQSSKRTRDTRTPRTMMGWAPCRPTGRRLTQRRGNPTSSTITQVSQFPLFQNVMLATSPSTCSLFSFVVLVKVSAKTFSSNFACEYEFDKGPAPLFSKKNYIFQMKCDCEYDKEPAPTRLSFLYPSPTQPRPPASIHCSAKCTTFGIAG